MPGEAESRIAVVMRSCRRASSPRSRQGRACPPRGISWKRSSQTTTRLPPTRWSGSTPPQPVCLECAEVANVSGEDFPDRLAVVDLEALATGNLQTAAVEAEQVQHRRVNVRHVMARVDRVEAQLVGRPVDDATLQPGTGEPDRETVRVM